MAIFLPILKTNGYLDNLKMTVVNVGSRKISQQDDYATQGWGIFAPNLAIYGFDADEDACEIANNDLTTRNINWIEKHIPFGLADTVGEKTLYVTKAPMCSSLYEPNEPFLNRFQSLAELAGLDFTIEIETTTLDDFCQEEGIEEIDFLQIDVQGADLDVLKGGNKIVNNSVLGIQIEVEFSPLYYRQPLFSEVDIYLRELGFTLFDLTKAYCYRKISPIYSSLRQGQILWGDAFYLQDLIAPTGKISLKNPEKILKLACISDILNFSDYSLELLAYLTCEYGKDECYNFAKIIMEILGQFPSLVEQGLDNLAIVSKIKNYL
jgi:FkbM family methyltransferase